QCPPTSSSAPSSPVASATRLTAVRTASPWRTGGASLPRRWMSMTPSSPMASLVTTARSQNPTRS
ncbi:unnamed protein product, partial [Closterium sp. NIES-53]